MTAIEYSLNQAFKKKEERGWEKWPQLYFAIDIHGTIIKPSYDVNEEVYDFYDGAIEALKMLSRNDKCCIILWSCSTKDYLGRFVEELNRQGIHVDYVNSNPECVSENSLDVSGKFYFDVCLEDKAGFNPDIDWFFFMGNLKARFDDLEKAEEAEEEAEKAEKAGNIHIERERLLGKALCSVLIANDVLRKDARPSGPELLVASEDFCESMKKKGEDK